MFKGGATKQEARSLGVSLIWFTLAVILFLFILVKTGHFAPTQKIETSASQQTQKTSFHIHLQGLLFADPVLF